MSSLVLSVADFINEKILRRSKEESIFLGEMIAIVKAQAMTGLRTKLNSHLKLVENNESMQWPLPNRFATNDVLYAKQQQYMIIKLLKLHGVPAGKPEQVEINNSFDRSQASIDVVRFLKTDRVA
jgi:hypothetical protein